MRIMGRLWVNLSVYVNCIYTHVDAHIHSMDGTHTYTSIYVGR